MLSNTHTTAISTPYSQTLSFCATRKLSRGKCVLSRSLTLAKALTHNFPDFSRTVRVWSYVESRMQKENKFLPWYITSESEFWRRTAGNCHPSCKKKKRGKRTGARNVYEWRAQGVRVWFDSRREKRKCCPCVCFRLKGKVKFVLTSKSYAFEAGL